MPDFLIEECRHAAADLGLAIEAPFLLQLQDGRIEARLRLRNFGAQMECSFSRTSASSSPSWTKSRSAGTAFQPFLSLVGLLTTEMHLLRCSVIGVGPDRNRNDRPGGSSPMWTATRRTDAEAETSTSACWHGAPRVEVGR